VFNTVVACLILWDATQNSAGKADWPHWFADGGYFLFSVMIGDALLMNAIEYFRPFDMLIPRYITGPKVVTQQRLNRLYATTPFFQCIFVTLKQLLPANVQPGHALPVRTQERDNRLAIRLRAPHPLFCFGGDLAADVHHRQVSGAFPSLRINRHVPPKFTVSTTQNQSCPLVLTLFPVCQVLRVYERPTSYNDRVATLASSVILPVCLLAHCFSGM
jgi:hypothetical protein